MRTLSKVVAVLGLSFGLAAGVLVATASAAFADYGPGASYQIEISANTHSLGSIIPIAKANGSGGGFWFWAALTPTSSSGGTVDYEEDDCIHNAGIAPNGDIHNAGNTTYTVSGDTLIIDNVLTGAGPVDITVPSSAGHYVYPDNSLGPLFGGSILSALPAQVQVAP